ncbi:hypothetical protein ACP70R_021998 [Stipagrostis hirtigluma subsp. patula]
MPAGSPLELFGDKVQRPASMALAWSGGPIAGMDGSGQMGVVDSMCAVEVAGGEAALWEESLPLPDLDLYSDPEPTDEEKVVRALHIVRCRQFAEYDPKWDYVVPTRFCQFNISLFDFEKDSTAGLGPPLCTVNQSDWISLQESVNLISMKILQSDVGYPISIYGTVLARDQVDYKCVYLFRRDRDDCQFITSQDDTLAITVTGPCRGLAVTGSMFFEINLKIKDDVSGDSDFSKGVIEHRATDGTRQLMTELLTSWKSTLELVYTPVPLAVEATLAVNILKGGSDCFSGEIIAWTTGNTKNHIILYDSKLTGTRKEIGAGGSVPLSRSLVAVPVDDELVYVFVMVTLKLHALSSL